MKIREALQGILWSRGNSVLFSGNRGTKGIIFREQFLFQGTGIREFAKKILIGNKGTWVIISREQENMDLPWEGLAHGARFRYHE